MIELEDVRAIAAAFRVTMAEIREDVAAGRGPDIEPDAVLMSLSANLRPVLGANLWFDPAWFEEAADLNDPIPSAAFREEF